MVTIETKDAYSNADGKGKEKIKNAFKPKKSIQVGDSDISKAKSKKETRKDKKTTRKNERIKRRLDKANAKLKPGATPLTEKDLPNGKQRFVGFFKTLFKRKTKNPKTGKEEVTYFEKKSDGTNVDLKPNEVQIIPTKIPNVEPLAVAKKEIDKAKENNATISTDGNGKLVAEYNEDNVVAVDSEDGSTDYYAPTDVENVDDAVDINGNKQTIFTTKNILITLGAVALIGALIYYVSKQSSKTPKLISLN